MKKTNKFFGQLADVERTENKNSMKLKLNMTSTWKGNKKNIIKKCMKMHIRKIITNTNDFPLENACGFFKNPLMLTARKMIIREKFKTDLLNMKY